MKQIISIKKDLTFKTIIGQISNINLNKDYKIKEDTVEGFISIFGSYKMTEASVLEEDFNYKIPFGVSIPNNIKKDTIKIEIEDFNYEFNKDILSVNIDLDFECDDYIIENNEVNNDIDVDNSIEDEIINNISLNDIDIENTEVDNSSNDINIEENINNITNVINKDENYYTYKVYIVREGDSIDDICNKYNVTLNDLKEYNDINNIGIGSKVIIPYVNE
jgi:LysM repeat protein